MRFLSLRAVFLLGFVVAMPVLALPPVARRIDELLYGPPPNELGRAPSAAPLIQQPTQPLASGPIAATRFQEPSPAAPALAATHSPTPAAPPMLAPTPQFALPSPPPTQPGIAAPE